MDDLLSSIRDLWSHHSWFLEVMVIVLITAGAHVLLRVLYRNLHPRLQKTSNIWDDLLVHALYAPLLLLVWIYGASFATQVAIVSELVSFNKLAELLPVLRDVCLIVAMTWVCLRCVVALERHILSQPVAERRIRDVTTVHAIAKLLKITILVIAFLSVLPALGFKISGLLALGGVGTLALSFGARDLIANFFGGVLLYFDRPFKVGDWIRSPDKEIEGTVEEISWRLTRIRTFDKRPLYVPNSVFLNISVENPSRMQNRRIKATVGVRYDDWRQIDNISQAITNMLKEHPEIDTRQTLFVNLVNFGPSSLDLLIYTFTKTTNWVRFQAIQHDVFLKILEIVDAHGGEVAFPTRTVHVQGADALPLADI